MEQCKCKCEEIKEFEKIENTPFLLVPKKEMICPQKYYMLCKECKRIIPFILEDGIYKCYKSNQEEE